MSLSLLFWVLYVVALVFGVWSNRSTPVSLSVNGSLLLFFILLGILGWKVFGPVIHN